jgi:hypothetical protein
MVLSSSEQIGDPKICRESLFQTDKPKKVVRKDVSRETDEIGYKLQEKYCKVTSL